MSLATLIKSTALSIGKSAFNMQDVHSPCRMGASAGSSTHPKIISKIRRQSNQAVTSSLGCSPRVAKEIRFVVPYQIVDHLLFNSIDLHQKCIPSVLSTPSTSLSRCQFAIERCQLVLQSTGMRTESEDPTASDASFHRLQTTEPL